MNVVQKYKPLYFDDFFIADCMGGRAGARSYSITQHALHEIVHTYDHYRAFLMREVHATIYQSLWTDFKDRINEYQEEHNFDLRDVIDWTDNKSGENSCVNLVTGNSITTKGFKASSNTQTANLKSIAAATHIYIDEADENSKDDFLKLQLSLRKKGSNIKVIRAFNPPSKEHWIWEDYTLTALTETDIFHRIKHALDIPEDEIWAAIKRNNKTYYKATPNGDSQILINTNFVDNYQNLNPTAIKNYTKIFREDFHYYMTVIDGVIANDSGDSVYYEYDRAKAHSDRNIESGDVLHIGMDFNVTNMSAVVHVVENDKSIAVAEHVQVFDTHQMCAKLKDLYDGHNITIYPDASGKNRKTSGKSDFDIIKEYGFKIEAPEKNPPVRDRINTMNSEIRKGQYLVNRFNCPTYSTALSKIKYKGGEPDKSSGYDHVTDAGGYYLYNQYGAPIQKSKATFKF